MTSKLQLALDDITLENSLVLLEKIEEYVDIVEVGTPFMMEYGMEAVRQIKNQFPSLEVLCDAKIMDAGSYEAHVTFNAGSDYVTVLGVTDDLTVKDVVKAAKEAGKKVMVDMICIEDLAARVPAMEALEVDVIAVHTGVDQQAAGRTPLDDLKEMRKHVKKAQLAVAGGINNQTITEYLKYEPEIIIIGSGIVGAADPVAAAKEMSQHLKGF